MLHHCRAVSRGAQHALLIGDMPFMSYQAEAHEAVRNAGRFLQEAGMDAVKLEGGRERLDAVRAILAAGIPVMGHLGLTPQSVHLFGGFRPQARQAAAAAWRMPCCCKRRAVSAWCWNRCRRAWRVWSQSAWRSTIGIGAGAGCDGRCW
jgi:3-methyl-2-oxobutanoate hydroxymethyltransferase